ncbi:MAG: PAS domain-containing protein [Acidimicrobiales bacterium]
MKRDKKRSDAARSRPLGREGYEAIFRFSLDAVMLTVPDGRVLAANPAACEMLRLKRGRDHPSRPPGSRRPVRRPVGRRHRDAGTARPQPVRALVPAGRRHDLRRRRRLERVHRRKRRVTDLRRLP